MILNAANLCSAGSNSRVTLGPFPAGTVLRSCRLSMSPAANAVFNVRVRLALFQTRDADTSAAFARGRQLIRGLSLQDIFQFGVQAVAAGFALDRVLPLNLKLDDNLYIGCEVNEVSASSGVQYLFSVDAVPKDGGAW